MRLVSLLACAASLSVVGCGGGSDNDRQRAETQTIQGSRTETAPDASQSATRLRLSRVGSFASPTALASPPDDRRQFVVEQGGRIRVIRGGRVLSKPFLDISRDVVSGGEQGLLGLAFAPDYETSHRFYVNYTNRSGDTRIVEFRAPNATADTADPSTARVVLRQDQPEPNHNGGQLAFGPDGLLYIGLGDGGGGNDRHGRLGNAQNLSSLLGKILRIDPAERDGKPYTVPDSNPFVGRSGARGEIWSYGLRNPWRFSFDRRTEALVIADVGQDAIEELDWVPKGRGRGANFGWRPFEGRRRVQPGEQAPGHVPPVLQLSHDDGYCSITGGYVVRDRALGPLYGRYVYGDFCDGRVRSVRISGGRATGDGRLRLPRVGSISSFGEDAQGRIYVLSLDGPVYRLTRR